MFLIISVITVITVIGYVSTSPYIAILPTTVPDGDVRSDEIGEMEMSTEQSLRSDCARLIRLYDRFHSESGTMSLLAEGQIDGHVLDACARFLLSTNRASPLVAITRDDDTSNWLVKKAERSPSDAQILQRRAYDYIRFGKRLMAAAKKRMQSSPAKNSNRKAGNHDYIRFGKK